MKKQLITTGILLLVTLVTNAQESRVTLTGDTQQVAPVKLYGFIRNYLNIDSRETYTVVGGEYNMIPFDERWNENHTEDLNANPHAQLQALTSRVGINVTGPKLLGWQSRGKLEADFGGFGNNNTVLRLRLAYVKFCRQNQLNSLNSSEFLVGQDWHPLSGSIMPEVLGMAAGAPFRPHSRTPQIRGTMYWKNWGYTAALLWQLQYMNNGPQSASNPTSVASLDYANHALWPEVFLGLNYRSLELYAQLGLDAQIIKPRTQALVAGITKKVNGTVTSFTPTLYVSYKTSKYDIQFRTLLAENTSHLNQMVGYAVTDVAPDGTWQYQPLRASISYFNIAYGQTFRANLFLGYMKNLGADRDLHNFGTDADPSYYIYMKGGDNFTHLNSVYRIAPSVSYNIGQLSFGIEYELTAATYGDLLSDGSVAGNANLHQVANHRICMMLKYSF